MNRTNNHPAFEGPGWRRIHRRRQVIAACAVCGALVVLAATFEPGSLRASGPPAPATSLGELWSTGYVVRILACEDGPRYTVCDPSGRVLAEALLPEDVAREFPELDPSQLRGQALMSADPVRPE